MKRKKKVAGWSITEERTVILRNWNDQDEIVESDDSADYASIAYYRRPSARARWSKAVKLLWDKYLKYRNEHDFWATIADDDPRSGYWQTVFGTKTVPIETPTAKQAILPGHNTPKTVYMLALHALPHSTMTKIVQHIATQFNLPEEEIQLQLYIKGVPLLADNLTITITNPQKWLF